MRFVVRVALGALLSAVTLGALLFMVGPKAWAIATGALLAPIGFLGSFFLWSADRPEDGYEQVLFDRPNTLVSLVLVLALAGAAYGAGFLVQPKNVDPGEAAYLAQRDAVTALADAYQADADAYRTGGLTEGAVDVFAEHRAAAEEIVLGLDESGITHEARLKSIEDAARALATVAATMERCAGGDEDECVNARLAMVDYQRVAKTLA